MDLAETKHKFDARVQGLRAGGQETALRASRAVRGVSESGKVQKVVLGSVLFIIGAALLYVPAAISYLVLYYRYIPELVTTIPVHLQYGVGPNPFGIASLGQLHARQPYDITVSLTLPRSPTNIERGNFMVALHLLNPDPTGANRRSSSSTNAPMLPYVPPARAGKSPKHDDSVKEEEQPDLDMSVQATRINLPAYLAAHSILHTVTRPALVPYVDPMASLAKRLLFLAYHMLFPRRATTVHLVIPMVEALALPSFPNTRRGGQAPGSLLLEVQAGQEIQLYEASVTFAAQLRGLRRFMYRWKVTAFVVVTGMFWIGELVFTGMGLLCLRACFAGDGRGGVKVEGRGGREVVDGGDVSELSGESGGESSGDGDDGRRMPVRSEGAWTRKGKVLKKEEESVETPLSRIPPYDGGQDARPEKDDQVEGGAGLSQGKWKGKEEEKFSLEDLGLGTSYSGQVTKEGARRRNISGQELSD
ncbi:putative adipose-regulatory protein-domain-containing protein [Chaetomium strumarium]|uniref:Adipose-regulatory protein-domain-containing protein n=1 Tax=Chaetomium strumarium TaxID=1170767 RepID=A0AAJ0LZE0_9PEZI|nr:putative adipose-regulatory protein-domain-containing protein [Chaetomium strumarium]